jgi:signal transduction histidine kinase
MIGTAGLYALLDRLAVNFQVEPGVSVLFPATAAAIIACMHGGLWGAAGVFVGSLVNPWLSGEWSSGALAFAGVNMLEGLIPWLAFRLVPGVSMDLRDLRSLGLFIISGTIVNTGLSATIGTSLIGAPESPTTVVHQMVVWWIADFSAAVLLATPTLAFADRLLLVISPTGETKRSFPLFISGTLRVTAAIVILGWSASAFVRNAVSERIETNRLTQQEQAFEARNAVNSLHSNFLRAATIESSFEENRSSRAREEFEETRELHFRLLGEVDSLVSRSTPAAIDQFNRLREKTGIWFSRARRELSGRSASSTTAAEAHLLSREFLNLKSSIENADAREWTRFRETRRRLAVFHNFVDGLVFVILVVAFATLLARISRPLDQLTNSISLLGAGSLPPAREGRWPFMELQTLDHALSNAAQELQQREGELEKQRNEAIEASRHKSAFLAKMSHELRTPLNSIIGFSELLRDAKTGDAERRRHFAENIGHSSRLLLTMIDDLLEIAKLESGSVSIRPAPCDLGDIVRAAVSSVAALASEKNQRVEAQLPEGSLPAVLDADKFQQVLLRLMMNAIKFSPEGAPIVVRGAIHDAAAEVEIEDHGVGIDPRDVERIFETFEQVYDRGVLSQGAGLGLTVARRFTEAQGGTILVRSNKGRGVTFSVRIPLEGE